jgi:hypothetical protein
VTPPSTILAIGITPPVVDEVAAPLLVAAKLSLAPPPLASIAGLMVPVLTLALPATPSLPVIKLLPLSPTYWAVVPLAVIGSLPDTLGPQLPCLP